MLPTIEAEAVTSASLRRRMVSILKHPATGATGLYDATSVHVSVLPTVWSACALGAFGARRLEA
eukprot:9203083-Pyramimonas_sp.AAC.1